MNKVVIVSAVRTPLGSFMGALSTIPAPLLGAKAISGALSKIGLDGDKVEEVFMGQVVQAGSGQAPARQASIHAGIPDSIPCTTINKVCASGMKAIVMATQAIALGDRSVVVAGGMENMSLAPHLAPLRKGAKFGSVPFRDALQVDGLEDAYSNEAMGIYADMCAQKHSINREEQDQYAISSYKRAAKASADGKFIDEIIPVEIPQRKGDPIIVSEDEEFSRVNFEKMSSLRAAFTKDGTVTAANASTINDGASALVLMSEQKAKELNLKPLAYIKSYADAALDPALFTEAPAKALPIALKKGNVSIEDIDFFEINEAFSVVSIANGKLLNIPMDKLNIHGGAVALGHPLGCSGARITTTLVHVLKQNNASLGAAAICNGGGGASALVIENIK
jgi:acetyl-CoA C-acetyltransferase